MYSIGDIRSEDYGRSFKRWDGKEWVSYKADHDIVVKDILGDLSDGDRTQEIIDMKLVESKDAYSEPRMISSSTVYIFDDRQEAFKRQSQLVLQQQTTAQPSLLNKLFGGGL